ncbi:hypothetical protein FBU30_003260 [Linnemannia zychae]|nr:hypothetical protein FBU30_003260 [Linnemannia zychae]
MRFSIHSFGLIACALLSLDRSVTYASLSSAINVAKRDNTVYVTVTEYRYIPASSPASAATFAPNLLSQSGDKDDPAFTPVPLPSTMASSFDQPAPPNNHLYPNVFSFNSLVSNHMPSMSMISMDQSQSAASTLHPLLDSLPTYTASAVTAMAWTLPINDALTYTSFAGLLSTLAPAFYPTLLTVSSHATMSSLSPLSTHSSIPDLMPASNTLEISSTAIASITPMTPISKESTMTYTSLSITSGATTSLPSKDTSTLPSTIPTPTLTTVSTEMTVSTTITTRGDTTSIKTTIGTDGVTTVLTEYPASTRTRNPQSTSGAQAGRLRLRLQQSTSTESVLEYLVQHLIFKGQWSMSVTAIIAALIFPGAVALLV